MVDRLHWTLVYRGNNNTDMVYKYNATTQALLSSFGGTGTGNYEFNNPSKVAMEGSNIYVIDTNNCRVMKYDVNGVFLTSWGSEGTGDGQFIAPAGIACVGSNIVVADTGNHRIQRFNLSGTFISKFGSYGTGNGQFKSPTGIAGYATFIYVVDSGNNRIQRLSWAMAYDSKWGGLGVANGLFNNPKDIAIDSANQLYVADYANNRIQKFSAAGAFLTKWQIGAPVSVAATSGAAIVYVVSQDNWKINSFDLNGIKLTEWGYGVYNGIAIQQDASMNLYVLYSGSVYKMPNPGNTSVSIVSTSNSKEIVLVDGSKAFLTPQVKTRKEPFSWEITEASATEEDYNMLSALSDAHERITLTTHTSQVISGYINKVEKQYTLSGKTQKYIIKVEFNPEV